MVGTISVVGVMKDGTVKYVIVTPAKNEEAYIKNTLESVCNQSLQPEEWIIVNDGSADNTAEIVKNYQASHSWIKLINNENRFERRASGSKVIRAFYRGYDTVTTHDYDFIVKLDADLVLPENYFEKVSIAFQENSNVGLCGGYCVTEKKGRLTKERTAKNHIRGAIKAYRKQCIEDIGGLKPVLGWDALDEMTASYLGWEIKQLPLEVTHLRETNREYKPLLHRFHSGMMYSRMGYGAFLSLCKAIFYVFNKPYMLGGLAFAIGFITALIRGEKDIEDKDLRRFVKKFKYNRILQFFHLK